jgi:hypothetical protein
MGMAKTLFDSFFLQLPLRTNAFAADHHIYDLEMLRVTTFSALRTGARGCTSST